MVPDAQDPAADTASPACRQKSYALASNREISSMMPLCGIVPGRKCRRQCLSEPVPPMLPVSRFRSLTLRAAACLLMASSAFCSAAWSFEPGVYSDRPTCDRIKAVVAQADRHLFFSSADQIVEWWSPGCQRATSKLKYDKPFGRDELKRLLSGEKTRETLIVTLAMTMTESAAKLDTTLKTIQPSLQALGYKRVLIIGAKGTGILVIADIQRGSAEASSSAMSGRESRQLDRPLEKRDC